MVPRTNIQKTFNKRKKAWQIQGTSAPFSYIVTVECVYWTEPKATCRQCKNQPNAYNMYTDLEGILSACLHLYVSFHPGVVSFCRYVFSHINAFTTVAKVDKRYV
jgi:hypothetical protein